MENIVSIGYKNSPCKVAIPMSRINSSSGLEKDNFSLFGVGK